LKFLRVPNSVFAFYPPSLIPNVHNLISTDLKISKRPVMIVTNAGGDRLLGVGMLLRHNNKSPSLQFFRMDYSPFNHGPGNEGNNWDVWESGQFHFHVPRN
jgi:hypothetical protein